MASSGRRNDEEKAALPKDPNTRSMIRLEHFLETVLRKELHDVLLRREDTSNIIAQCRQVRDLIDSIEALGKSDTATPPSPSSASSSSMAAGKSKDKNKFSTTLLSNIGNHFYMECKVPDASMIHINIGCGIVLPMPLSDAKVFLVKKEALLTETGQRLTRESLRVRFRMRLVMEAISRLSDAPLVQAKQPR